MEWDSPREAVLSYYTACFLGPRQWKADPQGSTQRRKKEKPTHPRGLLPVIDLCTACLCAGVYRVPVSQALMLMPLVSFSPRPQSERFLYSQIPKGSSGINCLPYQGQRLRGREGETANKCMNRAVVSVGVFNLGGGEINGLLETSTTANFPPGALPRGQVSADQASYVMGTGGRGIGKSLKSRNVSGLLGQECAERQNQSRPK